MLLQEPHRERGITSTFSSPGAKTTPLRAASSQRRSRAICSHDLQQKA